METKEDKAFGVIPVFKEKEGNFLFCVIRHAEGHFAFPKGHAEAGESEEETALRELAEETGITDITLMHHKWFTEEYTFEKEYVQYHKSVKYFLGFVPSMSAATPADFKDEIPELKWVTYAEAKETLTYPAAKKMLDDVFAYLQKLSVKE